MNSVPNQVVYAAIGLNLETTFMADTSFRWGDEDRFYHAITREVSAQKCWEKWGHLTRNKKKAPYAVWCIFAPGTKGRSGKDALARTALTFDIDTVHVSAQSLELALRGLGWESAFYTTWKSREDALRWRVVIPLATPHTAEGWDDFYSQKTAEFLKALEAHHGSSVILDKSAGKFVQAHILPHEIPSMFFNGMTDEKLRKLMLAMEKHEDSLPGLPFASVYGTRGVALTHSSTFTLSDGARRTLSPALFASEGKAARGERKAPIVLTEAVVYDGDCSTKAAKATAEEWLMKGVAHVPELTAGMDGALYLAEHGIHVPLGKRRDALVAALWNLHRVGWASNDIMRVADQIIFSSKKTDQEYLTNEAGKYLEKDLIPLEKAAAKMESAIFKALGQGKTEGKHIGIATKRTFARILSRAKHCYAPKGGALSQEQIAECIGLSKSWSSIGAKVVRAFFGHCERAGLLVATGEQMARRYRLIQPE